MTDPQQPWPAPAPPPYQAPAPVYQAPGAFSGPACGYVTPYGSAVAPRPQPALGRVALLLALVASVALTAAATVLAWQIAQGARATISMSALESGDLSFLTPVRDLVLWFEITGWAATALGIWALVQGIVAIAKNRGRGAGIAAVIIAGLGPFLFGIAVYIALIIGAAPELFGSSV